MSPLSTTSIFNSLSVNNDDRIVKQRNENVNFSKNFTTEFYLFPQKSINYNIINLFEYCLAIGLTIEYYR